MMNVIIIDRFLAMIIGFVSLDLRCIKSKIQIRAQAKNNRIKEIFVYKIFSNIVI